MQSIVSVVRKWFESSTKKQKLFASLLIFSLLVTGILVTMSGSSKVASDPLGSTPLYFAGAFFKLIIVLALIFGISVVYKRWLQIGPGGKAARQMRLIETIRLSPKQALHLVSVGGQKLLIGATDQNISLIVPANDCIDPAPLEETQPPLAVDFGALIRSFGINGLDGNVKEKE